MLAMESSVEYIPETKRPNQKFESLQILLLPNLRVLYNSDKTLLSSRKDSLLKIV